MSFTGSGTEKYEILFLAHYQLSSQQAKQLPSWSACKLFTGTHRTVDNKRPLPYVPSSWPLRCIRLSSQYLRNLAPGGPGSILLYIIISYCRYSPLNILGGRPSSKTTHPFTPPKRGPTPLPKGIKIEPAGGAYPLNILGGRPSPDVKHFGLFEPRIRKWIIPCGASFRNVVRTTEASVKKCSQGALLLVHFLGRARKEPGFGAEPHSE